jgi:hypothetical protein
LAHEPVDRQRIGTFGGCRRSMAWLGTETRGKNGMLETAIGTPLGLFDLLGVAGAALYVGNYTLLVTRRTSADRPGYFFINMLAAGLLLVSLTQAFNLGAALIQLFFCVMSVVGVFSRLRLLRRLRHLGLQSAPASRPIRWSRPGLAGKRL